MAEKAAPQPVSLLLLQSTEDGTVTEIRVRHTSETKAIADYWEKKCKREELTEADVASGILNFMLDDELQMTYKGPYERVYKLKWNVVTEEDEYEDDPENYNSDDEEYQEQEQQEEQHPAQKKTRFARQ